MTQPSAHQKSFISGLFNHSLRPPTLPHAACPYCYGDATSTDTCTLLTFRCQRGHEFLQTRPLAIAHGAWLGRLDHHRNGDL